MTRDGDTYSAVAGTVLAAEAGWQEWEVRKEAWLTDTFIEAASTCWRRRCVRFPPFSQARFGRRT